MSNSAQAVGRIALVAFGNYLAPGIGGVIGSPSGGVSLPKGLPALEMPAASLEAADVDH